MCQSKENERLRMILKLRWNSQLPLFVAQYPAGVKSRRHAAIAYHNMAADCNVTRVMIISI